jgi:predicted transcriptional regulator
MNSDPSDEPRAVAIEQLKAFGLSAYAAETFVTLVDLGTGTAKEVSRASDVPRTRVYDAVDELHEQGLVEVRHSSPQEFRAKSVETARQTFEEKVQRRIALMTEALQKLESRTISSVQYGVWTVEGQAKITEQVLEFVSTAQEEVVYATVDEVLNETVLDGLEAAVENDIDIRLSGLCGVAEDRLERAFPGFDLVDPPASWPGPPAGRLVMIDDRQTLVSVLAGSTETADGWTETAVWGSGPTNSLSVVLQAIIGEQLPRDEQS